MPTLTALVLADRGPSRPIKELLTGQRVDFILTLGDLDYVDLHDLANISDIPKLGVYGNHCSGQYMDDLGIVNMHLNTVSIGNVTFGGFEGSVRYKDSPYAKMYTQEEASVMLAGFPRVDIMLTHCPPYGVNDEPGESAHEGFVGLKDYVLRERPAYLLHGHTYPKEAELVRKLGDTNIEYVFGERVVNLIIP
jgi:hypothetical protein